MIAGTAVNSCGFTYYVYPNTLLFSRMFFWKNSSENLGLGTNMLNFQDLAQPCASEVKNLKSSTIYLKKHFWD